MKVCCGCMSTRSGTLCVLLLYLVAYIAGIVLIGLKVGDQEIGPLYFTHVYKNINCSTNYLVRPTEPWWCKALYDIQFDMRSYGIVAMIMLALSVVFDLIAVFGTAKGRYWPLLPWIVMEFIRLFAKVVFLIMVLIVWAIYVGENADYSHIIATGVIGAGATAFFYYLWLCVVSYFQLLREIDRIGNIHKVQDSPSHKVTPFMAGDYDNENPYDNMSQHTTETTTKDSDEIISVKSAAGTKSPIPDSDVVKTNPIETNE